MRPSHSNCSENSIEKRRELALPDRVVHEIGGQKITENELFEAWLRLPGARSLRNLQKYMLATHSVKFTLAFLSKRQAEGRWIEKAFAVEMLQEAETNRAAFETIRDSQVRRRAESMEIVGQVYDRVLRGCKTMVDSPQFERKLTTEAGPVQLKALIANLLSLQELQEKAMPVWGGPAGEPVVSDERELLEGPLDPLGLVSRLQALSKRQPLLELRADVEGAPATPREPHTAEG
jgi:hypothetical protein